MTPNEQPLFPQGRLSGTYAGKLRSADASAGDAMKNILLSDVKIDVFLKDLIGRKKVDSANSDVPIFFKKAIVTDVRLHYLDGSMKSFKVKLKKVILKKPNWNMSFQQGNRTAGLLEAQLITYLIDEDKPPVNWWKWSLRLGASLLVLLSLLIAQTFFEEVPKLIHERNTIKQTYVNKKDSFEYYCASAKHLLDSMDREGAIREYEKAKTFASAKEKSSVNDEIVQIYTGIARDLEKAKEYKQAIVIYTIIIKINPFDPSYLYKRGYCYVRIGNAKEAQYDFERAIHFNDPGSNILLKKNSSKKRKIIGYLTLCCDGTTTASTGQGTCSHHNGVCEENFPVYEDE